MRGLYWIGFYSFIVSSTFAFTTVPICRHTNHACLQCDRRTDSTTSWEKSTTTNYQSSISLTNGDDNDNITPQQRFHFWALPSFSYVVGMTLTIGLLATTLVTPAFADEYGVEKEAPTISTGETVEICTKRGPLGACLKTEMRTPDNENDISKKYFRDPSVLIQQQKMAVLQQKASDVDEVDGNELIQKLRQQSIDNREKNDLYVARKTFEADQSATFGPFDRQVLIMNTDGKTYTLLDNPVAMRLKKAGFINNQRSFITQPTQEDLDKAADKEPGFFANIMGSGNN